MKIKILLLLLVCQCYAISYQYDLAICTIFRDEARFLKEWIEFHRLVGVEHFYLYNNLSADDFEEVLRPYREENIVELFDWPYESFGPIDWVEIQLNAYRHCLSKVQGVVKWLALIDSDEFLVPLKGFSLTPILNQFADKGGLTVNWVLFGTSGVSKIPEGMLMIEALTLKGKSKEYHDTRVKSIVRPERVKTIKNVHYAEYKKGFYAVDESGKLALSDMSNPRKPMNHIRINHYWTRDAEFFNQHKMGRIIKNEQYNAADELNKEIDTNILRFAIPLRDRIFSGGKV